MRNMKKVTAFFLVTVMTLSLAACGGTGGDKKKDDYNGGKEVEIRNNGMFLPFSHKIMRRIIAPLSFYYPF